MASTPTDASREEHLSVAQRIAHAHGQIRDILDSAAGASPELEGFRGLIERLPAMLQVHFDDEERERGLFDTLRTLRPSVDPQLERLLQEHRAILQAVEILEGYLERLEATTDASERSAQVSLIQRETDALIRQLRDHERVESRLTADIIYRDEGGSG